jgi:hypothetical protein
MQVYHSPAPSRIGAGQYAAWSQEAKEIGLGPAADAMPFQSCEMQVELGRDAPILPLTGLLAWCEKLLAELRMLKKDGMRGATVWRAGEGDGVRVMLTEVKP